jgi:hypothetical protein
MVLRPGLSRIIIHEPIPTIGLTEEDANNLRDRVAIIIRDTLEKEGKCFFSRKKAAN